MRRQMLTFFETGFEICENELQYSKSFALSSPNLFTVQFVLFIELKRCYKLNFERRQNNVGEGRAGKSKALYVYCTYQKASFKAIDTHIRNKLSSQTSYVLR
jgi:hypothetical protein